METIKSAAIKLPDNSIIIGKDHAEYINKARKYNNICHGIQGFLTSSEKFIDRVTAGKIAFKAKQIFKDPEGGVIFSEELWSIGPCYYDYKTWSYRFKK